MASGSNRDNTLVDDEFSQAAGTPGGAHRGRKDLCCKGLRPILCEVGCSGMPRHPAVDVGLRVLSGGHPTTAYTKAAVSASSSPSASPQEKLPACFH